MIHGKRPEIFGHEELANQLAQSLRVHFSAQSQADSSLVIGIFGEWGSGKSNLLQLIGENFSAELKARIEQERDGGSPPLDIHAAWIPAFHAGMSALKLSVELIGDEVARRDSTSASPGGV